MNTNIDAAETRKLIYDIEESLSEFSIHAMIKAARPNASEIDVERMYLSLTEYAGDAYLTTMVNRYCALVVLKSQHK